MPPNVAEIHAVGRREVRVLNGSRWRLTFLASWLSAGAVAEPRRPEPTTSFSHVRWDSNPYSWGALATLTRVVLPRTRSRTNASQHSLLSAGARFGASLWKATNRPSGLMTGASAVPFASSPLVLTLISSAAPASDPGRTRHSSRSCRQVRGWWPRNRRRRTGRLN